MPAKVFPPSYLREDWDDAALQALVQDYIAWLAPYLLALPELDDTRRAGGG